MNINQLHETLNNEHVDRHSKQDELITFLKECVISTDGDVEKRKKLAYEIASILSTDYAQSLDSNETIDKILVLAGELEVDYTLDTWKMFSSMINNL